MNISKFFLVPIGLPGMGKTTLSRFVSAQANRKIRLSQFNQPIQSNNLGHKLPLEYGFESFGSNYPNGQTLPLTASKGAQQSASEPEVEIKFSKISYDKMLTDNMSIYQEQNPEVDMHHAIDITRGYSDRDYLAAITL
mmetsp:Transcript_16388/g.27755  ORF Transcript_16388/g.27755 Transcript_16388/m.27755 type:complete len:138 (+) Transcript_16388:341-754(+)